MKTPKYKKQTIKITKPDFLRAGGYTDNDHCLLATTLRRLGFGPVNVLPGRIRTSIGVFRYPQKNEKQIQRSYPQGDDGQCLCNRKPRPEAKQFSIVITPSPLYY